MLSLLPVPAFADNYIWLLHDGRDALAVDPGEAAPLRQALQALGLKLAAILVTHHHGDHVGGLAALRAEGFEGPVIGPADEAIEGLTRRVREGERLQSLGQSIRVLDVPGHTAGHIAFVVECEPPVLFCGDTLFGAGCGRLFEGTPAQMQASLAKLLALPPETRVCCAHEYTLGNLRFAQAVEPDNPALAQRMQTDQATRAAGRPTLPSTLALEAATNPFLRWNAPAVRDAARHHAPQPALGEDAVSVFAALRQWKNQF